MQANKEGHRPLFVHSLKIQKLPLKMTASAQSYAKKKSGKAPKNGNVSKGSNRSFKPAAIMLSKRANVLFVEHSRVVQKDGRVLYLTKSAAERDVLDDESLKRQDLIEHYFNVPYQNTMLLLLGQGTSITDSAARMLADANVVVGFVGSGGSPLFSAMDPMFLMPQSEYRPTEYMQNWMRMWLDEDKRLAVAKTFLKNRLQRTESVWAANTELSKRGALIQDTHLERFELGIKKANSTEELLSAEGVWAKGLYKILAQAYKVNDFVRESEGAQRTSAKGIINGMLTHGNYIAYGFSAVSLHALGVPSALPVLHGKTRRGALVFDVADLFKDWTVMPLAFEMGHAGAEDQDFRNRIIHLMHSENVVENAIDTIKKCCV